MVRDSSFFFLLFLCLMPCFYSHLFLTNFSHRILQDSSEKRGTIHFHDATVIRPSCQLPVVVCAVRQNTLLRRRQFGSSLRWQYFWSVLGRAVNHGLHKYLPVTIVYLHGTYIPARRSRVENFGGKMGF